MPLVKYRSHRFGKETHEIIRKANEIIGEYEAQGYDLTLRQLYYQFVSRDVIANSQNEYKRLGSIINDARLAGLIDWERITDRTRNLAGRSHWRDPSSIMASAAQSFAVDKWKKQPCRVEVWIEKEALAGVFERVCRELDVPYFSCRGYTSQSEMWEAGRRLFRWMKAGQKPVILHFGDHDPSGIDMTRDVRERLELFTEQDWLNQEMDLKGEPSVTVREIRDDMKDRCGARGVEVRRMALNMDQVNAHRPPPNPAKMTDSRATDYVKLYGDESWELDALDPNTLGGMVREAVEGLRDDCLWEMAVEEELKGREMLERAAERWDEIQAYLS